MAEPKNLGRGLSDLMQEVSTVKAVHTPPPAATEPAADAAAATPAKQTVVVEERASDAVINARQPVIPPP